MSQTPRKQPVQPWIPPQRPAVRGQLQAGTPAAGVVHVVHHHVHTATKRQVDAPLRAGWIFALVTGLLLGGGVALFVAGDRPHAEGLMVVGAIFGGIGYYLTLFLELVICVLAIVAMVRGAAARGILLLIGGPVLTVLLLLLGIGAGGLLRRGIVIEEKTASPAVEEAAAKPSAPADPVKSSLRVDEILADARKMLAVRDEATYAAAKNDAFAKAAYDPALTEAHREVVRTALNAIYAEADSKRKVKFPR